MNMENPSTKQFLKPCNLAVMTRSATRHSARATRACKMPFHALRTHQKPQRGRAGSGRIRPAQNSRPAGSHCPAAPLRSDEAPVRNVAMDILREIGSDSMESIQPYMQDEDVDLRIFITNILGYCRTHQSCQMLVPRPAQRSGSKRALPGSSKPWHAGLSRSRQLALPSHAR